MLPDPLHPALVHFPLALAVLVPVLALGWIYAIAKGLLAPRSWATIVLLQVVLVGSAWLCVETGERDEERVERVVAERHIEAHEESGKLFFLLSAAAAVLIAAGLLPGGTGVAGRLVGTLAAFAVLAAGVQVGHLGGELVYRHGAASAWSAADPDDR